MLLTSLLRIKKLLMLISMYFHIVNAMFIKIINHAKILKDVEDLIFIK